MLRSHSWWQLGICSLAVVVLASASSARANEALRWKFTQGDKLPYVLVQKSDILVDASGVEFEVTSKQVMDLTWTVDSVASDGTAEITQTIDRFIISVNSPLTGLFEFDSAAKVEEPEEGEEGAAQPGGGPGGQMLQQFGPLVESMIGAPFKMKVTPQGDVQDVQLPEKLVELLEQDARGGGGSAFFALLLGGGFGEDNIKEMVGRAVVKLPEDATAEGAEWHQEFETKLGPLGVQRTKVTFSYAGDEERDGKNVRKIATSEELTLELAGGGEIEMELVGQEASGAIYFDPAAGRVVEATNTQKVEMEGDFMGNEIFQERSTTTTLKAGTSADLPAEEEESAEESESAAE